MPEESTTEAEAPETTQQPTTNIEETIMSEAEPTETDAAEGAAEPSLFDETENLIDAETRPEWLPEKFKTGEDLSKSYKELEKKLGAHSGAPEKYEDNITEGLEDYAISIDDPFGADFNNLMIESGVNQDTHDKLLNLYYSKEKSDDESIEFAQEEQFKNDTKELGPQGVQEVKDAIQWAKGILPEGTYNMLRAVGNKDLTVGKMIKQFHDAYNSKNYVEMPSTAEDIISDVDMKEKARTMQADDRYNTDKKWRKATDDLYVSLYG